MSTVEQIEQAVKTLTSDELIAFREWFADYDAALWDREIEEDAAAGRLDELADQAVKASRKGRCTDL